MPAYRSRSIGGDPTRSASTERFRPGLHAAVLGPILVVTLLVAAVLAKRGSREVAIHLHRGTSVPSSSPSFLFDAMWPSREVGVYDVKMWGLFGGSHARGSVEDGWSRPIVLQGCHVGFASSTGTLERPMTYEQCSSIDETPSLRSEQARAVEQLEAFRRDASASSVDVVYGSRWGGAREALAALGIGAIFLIAVLFWSSAVTIDHARGELRIEERRFFATRRRVAVPLADITGVCVETSRRWRGLCRVSILSRAVRIPVTVRYSFGEKRHVALRLRLEAALAGGPQGA